MIAELSLILRGANKNSNEATGDKMTNVGVLKYHYLFELITHLMQVYPVEAIGASCNQRQNKIPVERFLTIQVRKWIEDYHDSSKGNETKEQTDSTYAFLN